MKKLISLFAIIGSLAMSATAMAVDTPTAIASSTTISNVTDCSVLSNDVTVQLSDGVVAAYDCNASPDSVIAGACHTSGTNKSQDFDCTYTSSTDGSGNTIYLTADGCPAWDGTGSEPVATYTNSGVVGFVGGSGGGSVTTQGMGVTSCDTTTVVDLIQ